jgi:hypothetical protein
MVKQIQFFAKKVTFNLVQVAILAVLFQVGQIHTSTSGYDYDEEYQSRIARSVRHDYFLDEVIDPIGRDGAIAPACEPYQGWDIHDEEYQDFLSLEPLVASCVKASSKQDLEEGSAFLKSPSTMFPDLSTAKSASSFALLHSNIPKPPSLLPAQAKSLIKKDDISSSATSLPLVAKFSTARTGLNLDIDLPVVVVDQKNQKLARTVSFVSSSDVAFLSEEFKHCRNRKKELLSMAKELDETLAQGNSGDKK